MDSMRRWAREANWGRLYLLPHRRSASYVVPTMVAYVFFLGGHRYVDGISEICSLRI
jgi:hypothetical protein